MKRSLAVLALLAAAPLAARADEPLKRPLLATVPDALEFQGESGQASFKIVNRGNEPLELRRVAVSADAYGYQVNDPGARTLQPGAEVDVQVTYRQEMHRRQAFGGVQIYSNDARFPSDARDPATHVAGV